MALFSYLQQELAYGVRVLLDWLLRGIDWICNFQKIFDCLKIVSEDDLRMITSLPVAVRRLDGSYTGIT